MQVSAQRAFKLLKELAGERLSCSQAEKDTAERLLKEALAAGADEAHIEEFTVACGRVDHAKLVVTEPYTKEYEVTGYERSESTPDGGIDLPFYYAENVHDSHLPNVKGKAVLINDRLRRGEYEKLKKAGAAAILTFSGSIVDRRNETDCDIRKLRDIFTEPFGSTVAMNMRAADALEIVHRGAKQMHLEFAGENYEGTSHNVCAVVKGTTYPDHIVSVGAHYDTVHFSHGVLDNMSGSVIMLELLRYFAVHKPSRTIKFNWYGSEEQGLLGSEAWTKAHKDELDKHIMMFNIDVAAPVLGRNCTFVMASESAANYVDGLVKEIGIPCSIIETVYSGDSVNFTDNGIPAINFCRVGAPGAEFIHERRDCLKTNFIDANALKQTLDIALHVSERMINSVVFPIKREISGKIKEQVDKYLFKDSKK